MYDIIIIGAGVVGGLIARELSAYDLNICIVEKEHDVAMGASGANSGIVHAGYDAKPGTLKAKLNVLGSRLMPKVARELGVKYQNNGSMVIGFSEDDRSVLEGLLKRGLQNGVKDLRIVGQDELRELEPALSKDVHFALLAPTGSIICPYELTIAAIGNAMDNGAHLELDFPVEKIKKTEEGYEVISGEKSLQAKYVINAAGVYGDDIAAMAGDDSFSIHPRRGEYILLDRECGNLISHTVFRTPGKMGKGILITPTVDGNLLAGPTAVDIEDKENTETTQEGLHYIMKQACENVPDIPFGKTITSFCGLRSVGNTGDFIIKASGKGFINVSAIESPGLSASPAIALYVIDLLKEQGLNLVKKESYDPIREPQHKFHKASMEEKNEMIKKNPAYGKIVCRCETVSEGEILDAIRRNPKARDLDGVKRRTRAQMGRCQGGFCSAQIMELLAREWNIPYEKVTKSGGDSYINIGRTKEV